MSLRESEISALVVAAASTGSGKTSVSVGLMARLRKMGYRVQGYKVGPDYLDPMYHRLGSGRPSRNLDSYLMPDDVVRQVFWKGVQDADVAVVEGVMGLYDGKLEGMPTGSTAEVASLLQLPVLLVVDVAGQAQTAAAVVLGLVRYSPDLKILGAVLNRVGSTRHGEALRKEIEGRTGIPVVGCIPRAALPKLPERHLGLVPVSERSDGAEIVEMLGEAVGRYVDVERILNLSRRARQKVELPGAVPSTRATIAVARDHAFNFYYEDNLDLLREAGGQIVEFSPMFDPEVPSDAQGLYLGGGYPEVFADQLSKNLNMMQSIRSAAAQGMPIYAECGGLMYLSQGIQDTSGRRFPMVGLIGSWTSMRTSRARLGYVDVEVATSSWFARKGERWRGHEYHWSELEGEPKRPLYRYLAPYNGYEGVVAGATANVLASYVHLHFASVPDLGHRFVKACLGDPEDR